MTPAQQLRRDIEDCELAHPMFIEHTRVLKQCVDDALAGFEPKISRVPGPSRAGKSSLIATLARAYPQSRVGGRLVAPVLVVNVPQGASPKDLPYSVLNALGLNVTGIKTVKALFDLMKDQLKLAGTRVVIFDEISHLVDEGSRVPPRAASDWLKSLLDTTSITLIFFGIPRLERLFSVNDQLRNRSRPARLFLPYDASDAKEMAAYTACVMTYARMFVAAGYPISVPPRVLIQQCYLLTGGLVGMLSDFMKALAKQASYVAPRALTYTDCQLALEDVSHAGSPHQLAFLDSANIADEEGDCVDVSLAVLKQAYVHVLTSSSTSVPVRKKSGDK